MPFSRHHLPEHNFVLTRVSGPITDQEVEQNIRALNEEHLEDTALLELGDTRGLHARHLTSLTMGAMLRASRLEEGQRRVTGGKLAIVAEDTLIYGFARAYTTLSAQHRDDADAFRELTAAIEWLGLGPHASRILDFMEEARRRDEQGRPG